MQGARHRHRRRAFDRGCRRHACAPRGRKRLHRPAAVEGQLPQHSGAARGLRDHRRRRGASGLRLLVRKRALCRNPRRSQPAFHRTQGGAHPHHGRQDRGEEDRQAPRHSGRARLRRRRQQRRRRDGDRQADRLSGAGEGRCRRRRPRHEGRAHRRRSRAGAFHRAQRSQGRVRRRRGLSRKISREAAPHRNPDPRRRPRRRDPPWRARLLAAAAAPEGMGGRPLAGARCGPARTDRRDGRCRHARPEVSRRRHHRISLRGRRVLLHRDEHPHPGRAPGDRDDHRHRSRAGADPRRRRRRIAGQRKPTSSSTATPSNAA